MGKQQFCGLLISLWLLTGCSKPQSEVADYSFVLPSVEAIPQFELALSVRQAYQAIPHQRTEYDATFSRVPAPEKEYLALMFPLIDQAIAVRVVTLQNFNNGQRTAQGIDHYAELITFVEAIEPPPTLQTYHQDLARSLQAQQAFFKDWRAKGSAFGHSGRATGSHRQVQKASGHLISAYNQLMQRFPNEDSVNKSAFFDYHCALDFI
ncbi:MAG: hypothetical protein AAFP03_04350 [Cyanobacteria bacterium J06598_3]